MPLSFPQIVRIKNPRLQVMYNCLMIGTVALVVGQFFLFGHYRVTIPFTGRVSMQANVIRNLSSLHEFSRKQASRAFCATPQDYDFWKDVDGDVRYENHRCIDICANDILAPECMSLLESTVQEAADRLFFVSHMSAAVLGKDGPNYNAFVPGVEALSMQLEFHYDVPIVPWYDASGSATQAVQAYSSKGVTVVVLDGSQKHVKTIPPGGQIVFSVAELLELAGRSLDDIVPESGPNFKTGAKYSRGPSARLTGVEMQMQIECFDREEIPLDVDVDWKGQICYMQLKSARDEWALLVAPVDRIDKDFGFHRIFHGVRVAATLEGDHAKADINAIFLNLCASAVLFRIPEAVLFVLALWSLGHTSRIYRRMVFRDFSIAKESAGMAMRLMEHAVNFESICGGARGGITSEQMRCNFNHIMGMRGHALDENEIDAMVAFCLNTTTTPQKEETQRRGVMSFLEYVFEDFIQIKSKRASKYGNQIDTVDLDSFELACSSAEPMSFDAFVHLFDQDRTKTPLETFFEPPQLKRALKLAENRASVSKVASESKEESNYAELQIPKREPDHEFITGMQAKTSTVTMKSAAGCVDLEQTQALEARFVGLEQHIERRFAELEQRLSRWINPQLEQLGLPKLNAPGCELLQAMNEFNGVTPDADTSLQSTSMPQESTTGRLVELEVNTIERPRGEQFHTSSDRNHNSMHSLLRRFEAHIDSIQSAVNGGIDRKESQTIEGETNVVIRSDEHISPVGDVSDRLARLEREVLQLREEVGAFDWKLEHKLEATIAEALGRPVSAEHTFLEDAPEDTRMECLHQERRNLHF